MNLAPLYVGPGTPAMCQRVSELRQQQRTVKDIAAELGLSPSTVRRYGQARVHMRDYTVTLHRQGEPRELPLAYVTTPKGEAAAAWAAYRRHKTFLNRLELPGWGLLVNGQRFALDELRKATAKEVS